MNHDAIIQLEDKYYISTNSSYANNRIKVLNYSDTFAIFDLRGDILQLGEGIQGVYHQGTRFLSESSLLINDRRPVLLSSTIKEENEILSVDLTNEFVPASDTHPSIPKGSLHIARSKFLRNGSLFEIIEFMNYANFRFDFSASLSFCADYRDIFEIRGIKREKRGEIFETLLVEENILRIRYRGLDNIERTTQLNLSHAPYKWENQNQAFYNISLEPHHIFTLEYSTAFDSGKLPAALCNFAESKKDMEEELGRSAKKIAHVYTSNEQLNHWVGRSNSDLISLLAQTETGFYPYAGVPWYNTPFGRDGIITAYQTLWAAPEIAREVLLFCAKNQATEMNAAQNAEPGKIFHELRGGEMVECNEVPFKRYYGSVDSTPLFIVLAGAYFQRTNDADTIQKIWPNVLAALSWIEQYGDVDGDGFTEYKAYPENGLLNQGWKDSTDSISDEFGNLAALPVALCEVQGYVYMAKIQAARLAMQFGNKDFAQRLKKEAEILKKQFHKAFWDDELNTYVIALDGNKRPCRVRSSNAGHCLFSGIADPRIAGRLVQTLMADDMFNGWGIRTLSSLEKRYNPMSYHNGSVWPHDVALIALGFARYGFRKEAMFLTGALFDASLFIEFQRLPELFCGFARRRGEGPTSYPVACSPQAWSVGAVYMLLESCLNMEIAAPRKKVFFKKPLLPDYMDNILIRGLLLGSKHIDIELHRYKDDIGLNVRNNNHGWEILVVK